MDALWLETLQRISHRAAHELKGALNGASVNLEVVRSRASKPRAAAAQVITYAAAAQDQLEVVIAMSDALLSLAREAQAPIELAPVVRRMNALLAPAAKAGGRALEMGSLDHLGATSAAGNVVRSAIGACLLAAIEASGHVKCEPVGGREDWTLRIESCDGATIPCDKALIELVARSGVRIQAEPYAISISFPR